MEAVYGDLKRVARRYMANERAEHTFQPTLLVNEVLVRLFPACGLSAHACDVDWKSRVHFKSIAAKQMRRILIDYAQRRRAAKRAGPKVNLQDLPFLPAARQREFEFDVLDDLLNRLAEREPNVAKTVELKFFSGMDYSEIAEAMNLSVATVRRNFEFGKAWLRQRMES